MFDLVLKYIYLKNLDAGWKILHFLQQIVALYLHFRFFFLCLCPSLLFTMQIHVGYFGCGLAGLCLKAAAKVCHSPLLWTPAIRSTGADKFGPPRVIKYDL